MSTLDPIIDYIDREFPYLKFRHLFLFIALISGFIILDLLLYWNISISYLIIYIYLVLITYYLIRTISDTIYRYKSSKIVFFVFLIKYVFIMLVYIWIFALLYNKAFFLEDGYFLLNDKYFVLTMKQSLLISGFSIFSYDMGYFPINMAQLFLFIEIFISQVVILGFLFVILGDFINRMKEKETKG